MARDDFQIRPEKDVGKTLVLHKGSESGLKSVRDQLDSVKSSEVYPSFEENFDFAVYFYDTSESFLSTLNKTCKNQLKPAARASSGTLMSVVMWLLMAGFGLFVLYFLLQFALAIMESVSSVSAGVV